MKIMKKRKIPMRKDIVTGEMMPKRQLIRVVKNKENEVSLDPTGKKPGRGAYVAVDVDIAKRAKKEKTFEKTGIRLWRIWLFTDGFVLVASIR